MVFFAVYRRPRIQKKNTEQLRSSQPAPLFWILHKDVVAERSSGSSLEAHALLSVDHHSSDFLSWNLFILLKVIENPKELWFVWIISKNFTGLEIKTKILNNY